MGKKKVTNKLEGNRYYGLHFQPGVAEYPEFSGEDGKPLRIYINGDTAKKMDASFDGKPVYVDHKSGITDKDFQEADGYVWKSFFNKSDGNHWVSFIVTTERGEEAIKKGWKLSNAYYREIETGPGDWHSVPYDSEVKSAKYDHLAIVNSPRYEESIILTPEEFRLYNEKRDKELLKLANSKTKKTKKRKGIMFNVFKKTKIENEESADLKEMVITLPKSGKELSLEEVIQNADAYLVNEEDKDKENKKKNKKKNEDRKDPDEEGMENEGHDDKKAMNEEEMAKVVRMVMKEMNNMKEEEKKENKKKNDDDDKDMENGEDEEKKDKMDNSIDFIKQLQNAGIELKGNENKKLQNEVDLASDQLARGKARY